jgi:hypothetical protein
MMSWRILHTGQIVEPAADASDARPRARAPSTPRHFAASNERKRTGSFIEA